MEVGGGTGIDWSTIGYLNDEPENILDDIITNGYNYALQIQSNWDVESPPETFAHDYKLVFMPLVDMSNCALYDGITGFFEDCANLITVPKFVVPDGFDETTCLFKNCVNLTTIPSLDMNGFRPSASQMFYNCRSLTVIPSLDLSQTRGASGFCEGCESLTTVGQLFIDETTDINRMFYGCTSLVTAPQLSYGESNYDKTMNYMFFNCTNLTNIPQDYGSFSLMGDGENMFYNCGNLSNDSLNNILGMCISSTSEFTGTKMLRYIGLSDAQAVVCTNLSNYQAFLDAGWTTGY